ncbi:Hypothetical predicted protein [Mytilus galloprovincialis]|uniref:Ig-like domain-containing protein n=1 Tax=Mytilus galloprovincialis TaxID=29158 RepID=A0A8B6EET2_MYTGA|nr:Hypothetical predicted protein [Mytilus galloprovincialis]
MPNTILTVLKSMLGEPPTATVSPDRQNVVKGKAPTLNCSVSGKPLPNISWMRVNNGEEAIINLPSEKYTGGNVDVPSLTIIDFNIVDEGIYVCKATNEAGEALSNYLHLTYIEPPTATVSPDRQNVVKGKAPTLNCSVSGKPLPNISWMRVNNGEEAIINLPSEKYTGGNVDVPSLTIIDFNIVDEGIYVCKATNEAGEALSNYLHLTYIEPPTAKVTPDRQNVVKGKAPTLNCSVSGKPLPNISWMRVNNGEEAIINLPSEKYTGGNVDVPSLTIIDFNKVDEGIYVCKATNEAGEALSNYSHLTYIGEQLSFTENISATEAFTLAETQVKYNFPVSVTLRHQLKVKLPDNESNITDCIKIGQTLVFADCYGSQLIICNADGTDQRHIPLHRKPWHITEIDSDTVAVSCSGRSIGIINISTDEVTSTVNTRKYCRAIAYDDNNLYVAIGEGIIHVIDQAGMILRSFNPLSSKRIYDITVKGKMLVCIYETSIYCCSMHGKLIWKFENEMYQSLNSVTTDDKDNVYVSDFISNAVLVVSGEGKQYRELLTKSDGLNGASIIHFDRNENILLVCTNDGGKAFLFDIKNN